MNDTCGTRCGPVWKCGGETCSCILPKGHEGWHHCDCSAEWCDV